MAEVPKNLEGVAPQDIANMAALLQTLATNPATSKELKRLTKKAVPTLDIPELDLEDQIQAAVKGPLDEVTKLRENLQQRDARERLGAQHAEAMRNGVAETEIADGSFQKWANEQGFAINQLGLAAKFRAGQNALQPPTPPSNAPMLGGKLDEAGLKKMRENPDKFLMEGAMDEINKINARKRASA